MTFSEDKKAMLHLKYAKERRAEAKEMIKKNKADKAAKVAEDADEEVEQAKKQKDKAKEKGKDVSKVELILNKNSTFTAKAEGEAEINGIIKGQGNDELILDNVLLSLELKKDSTKVGSFYIPHLLLTVTVSQNKFAKANLGR